MVDEREGSLRGMNQLVSRPIVPKTGLTPRRMKATKAEQERYEKLKAMGCIVTRLYFGKWAAAEIHHITEGGRRIGNLDSIPLRPWYHQAKIPQGFNTTTETESILGPTLHSKRAFVARFGSEEWLLEQVNKLLEAK